MEWHEYRNEGKATSCLVHSRLALGVAALLDEKYKGTHTRGLGMAAFGWCYIYRVNMGYILTTKRR